MLWCPQPHTGEFNQNALGKGPFFSQTPRGLRAVFSSQGSLLSVPRRAYLENGDRVVLGNQEPLGGLNELTSRKCSA